MTLRNKAQELLTEWGKYKHVHYNGSVERFSNVVDIEMEKQAIQHMVEHLQQGMLDDSCPQTELKFRVTALENHLRIFKDQITIELLKNG